MKTKQFLLILLACLCFPFAQLWSNPVNGLLERIDSYNPQIEMFARFKMKSSFHKTKRII